MIVKKMAIYGDSFGTHSLSGNPSFRHKGMLHHWSTLIKNKYNCELDNFSLSGSSVYYSFKKFKETHQLYDLIIFLVTEPGRYIKPIDFSFDDSACITNQAQIDVWRKTRSNFTENDLEKLGKLDNWFEMSDNDYNYDISELIVESINDNGNVIILPCYEVSMRPDFRNKLNLPDNVNLCSLYYKQMDELKLSDRGMNINWVENCEYISGHLTPEYNKIAFENIDFYIQNKSWNWVVSSDTILDNDLKNNYYNKI